ncbi:hypothetical protein GCM10010151_37330 [Actinoallomurus spadix]|uniref:Uncharacterized protein n=1 Tax=Actinoallomurus spadix TaxID=79912 RepID=A0ABP3GFC8_9ACTN
MAKEAIAVMTPPFLSSVTGRSFRRYLTSPGSLAGGTTETYEPQPDEHEPSDLRKHYPKQSGQSTAEHRE